VLIAGPTASGKSALALALCQKNGGVVINADSMQVYRDLRIITARPTPEEEARVPAPALRPCRCRGEFLRRRWSRMPPGAGGSARAKNLADLRRRLRPLFQGIDARLSAVPPIPAEIRDEVRARLERDGVEALHALLGQRDPVSAERLKPRDRTRIARAPGSG